MSYFFASLLMTEAFSKQLGAWFRLLAITLLCFCVRNLCLGFGWRTQLSPEECPPTLITVALTSTLRVGVCLSSQNLLSKQPPKGWGFVPRLSCCLSQNYRGLWAPRSICVCSRFITTPGQVSQVRAESPAAWPPCPLAPLGSSQLLASVNTNK